MEAVLTPEEIEWVRRGVKVCATRLQAYKRNLLGNNPLIDPGLKKIHESLQELDSVLSDTSKLTLDDLAKSVSKTQELLTSVLGGSNSTDVSATSNALKQIRAKVAEKLRTVSAPEQHTGKASAAKEASPETRVFVTSSQRREENRRVTERDESGNLTPQAIEAARARMAGNVVSR